MFFVINLTYCLAFISLLTSHPTEPESFSWQNRSRAYRMTETSSRSRSESGIHSNSSPTNSSRVHSSVGQSRASPDGITRHQVQDPWQYTHERSSQLQFPSSEFPSQAQAEPREGTDDPPVNGDGRSQLFSAPGEEDAPNSAQTEDYDSENGNTTYSSHVNCEGDRTESTPIIMEKDGQELTGGREYNQKQQINFEEVTRNFRRGSTRKGGANAISTTEKNVRHQPRKGNKRPRPTGSKVQGGQIVFPDYRRQKFTPRGTKCGKRMTFCEHIGEEYPTEYINQVLKREGAMFREFFGKDVISDPNITERIHAPEENSLCPFRQEVVFPRAAKNKEDKWLFVVNQDQYVQGVTVEVCLNPESRCILTEGFPLGYTPYCKQKYIERRLVAIGEDGKPHSDSFRLPSCCSCVVKHETSSRMGSLRTTRNTSPAVGTKPYTPP